VRRFCTTGAWLHSGYNWKKKPSFKTLRPILYATVPRNLVSRIHSNCSFHFIFHEQPVNLVTSKLMIKWQNHTLTDYNMPSIAPEAITRHNKQNHIPSHFAENLWELLHFIFVIWLFWELLILNVTLFKHWI